MQGRVVSHDTGLADQLRAENADQHRQISAIQLESATLINGLEAHRDEYRGQVIRLEQAANRPIEAIIASYERVSRQYGPAAVGEKDTRP